MPLRLCCVVVFCLLSWVHPRAEILRYDVAHSKAFVIEQPPVAQQVYVSDSTQHRKHKLIAALLAFPLGVFGLHRMYLGTSTITPLLYMATFGGLFGVLPFIDFVLIVMSKDVNATYAHNKHTFMWSKKKK